MGDGAMIVSDLNLVRSFFDIIITLNFGLVAPSPRAQSMIIPV